MQEEETSRWTLGRFSPRELATLFASGFILLAILSLYWARQRELARLNACQDNLREIGVLFFSHAETDPRTRLCSGAPNLLLDGPLDQTGWVADLVKLQSYPALKCAANPVQGLRTYNDVVRLDGVKTAERLRQQGLDTNYTASWFLGRMAIRTSITPDTSLEDWINNGIPYFDAPVAHRPPAIHPGNCTGGGLTLNCLERSHISISVIPLLADANSVDVKSITESAWSLNPGPAKVGAAGIVPIAADAPLKQQIDAEFRGLPRATQKNSLFLQDTRGWGTPHADWGGRVGNLLMADGSVRAFRDADGDGYLNPGFITRGKNGTNLPESGYQGNTVELPPAQMFNGVFLRRP